MSSIKDFLEIISLLHEQRSPFRITLSKPRKKGSLKQIKISLYGNDENITYQIKRITHTQETVSNYSFDELPERILEILENEMFYAQLHSQKGDYQLVQNKKSAKLLSQKTKTTIGVSKTHNKKKNYLVPADRPFLHALGLTSKAGNVFNHSQKKYRQINKFIELVEHLMGQDKSQQIRIADMGCGKGYLSFALYDYLTTKGINVELTGYEIREDIVSKINDISRSLAFDGLKFEVADIQNIELNKTDVVIALHACDIATDIAIHKGIKVDAKHIIVAPCCQKQVRKSMNHPDHLHPFLKHGIYQERMAEMLTDSLRGLFLESEGYQTKIFEFISYEHTSKNIMLTASKGKKDSKAIDHIEHLKQAFGIQEHYLGELLKTQS